MDPNQNTQVPTPTPSGAPASPTPPRPQVSAPVAAPQPQSPVPPPMQAQNPAIAGSPVSPGTQPPSPKIGTPPPAPMGSAPPAAFQPTQPNNLTPPPTSPAPPSAPGSAPTPMPSSTSSNDFKPKGSPLKKILIMVAVFVVIGLIGGIGFYFYNSQQADSVEVDDTPISQEPLVPAGETLTLEYWGLWDDESIMEEAFLEFETENPGVTVNYVLQSPEDYRDRLSAALARGEGPDIFRYHNTWVPMLRNDLSKVPNSVYSSAEYTQTFYPVISRDMQSDGGFVGLPLMIDGLGLYYNRDIFDTAGLQPPTTWNELQQTAQALTISSKEAGIERAGVPLGLTNNVDNFSDIVGLMLLQNGANPAQPNDPDGLGMDALNFYLLFARGDARVWNSILPSSTAAFAIEKSAMLIAPAWRAHEIVTVNPDINFGIVPVPQLPESEVSWATYWVEGVSAQSQNQRASWALLKHLTEQDSLRTMYTAASKQRLFGNPFPRVDMADQLLGDPYVGAFIQQAPIAQSWYLSSNTFGNGINDRSIKYYEDALNVGFSKKETMPTLVQGIEQVLQDYAVTSAR